MSEHETRESAGAPPMRIEITGAEYLAPTYAPAETKKDNYYTHSGLIALGRFRKGHELAILGDVRLRAWVRRIFTDDIRQKELERERVNTVVGQLSRGMDGYTSALLTKQTIEYREVTPQKRSGILGRLFG